MRSRGKQSLNKLNRGDSMFFRDSGGRPSIYLSKTDPLQENNKKYKEITKKIKKISIWKDRVFHTFPTREGNFYKIIRERWGVRS